MRSIGRVRRLGGVIRVMGQQLLRWWTEPPVADTIGAGAGLKAVDHAAEPDQVRHLWPQVDLHQDVAVPAQDGRPVRRVGRMVLISCGPAAGRWRGPATGNL